MLFYLAILRTIRPMYLYFTKNQMFGLSCILFDPNKPSDCFWPTGDSSCLAILQSKPYHFTH